MHVPGLDAHGVRALLIVLLALPMGLAAQRSTPPVPRAIREIKEVDLRRDLFAMASPAMRGREGGTLDEMRASMWVAEQYRRIGLTPGISRAALRRRRYTFVRREPAARSLRQVHIHTARLRIRYVSQGSSAWPALVWAFLRQQCRGRTTAA